MLRQWIALAGLLLCVAACERRDVVFEVAPPPDSEEPGTPAPPNDPPPADDPPPSDDAPGDEPPPDDPPVDDPPPDDPPVDNQPPVADAGPEQSAVSGDEVELDGRSSADSDGTIVSFSWSQTDGPAVDLLDADQAVARFIAPDVAEETVLAFELTVTDDDGASHSDSTRVTVRPADPDPDPEPDDEPGLDLLTLESEALLRGCDPIDAAACLLPFPSNYFTRTVEPHQIGGTARGGTGRRVNFNPLAMPRNVLGKPIDPTEWNRNDGFSPGQMILTRVPGIALLRDADGKPTGPVVNAPAINDQARFADPDISILVLDAETGERHPVWAEIDVNAGLLFPPGGTSKPGSAQPTLIIRPARNFDEGRRYVVVLRDLVDEDGAALEADPYFARCRDSRGTQLPDTLTPALAARCAQLRDAVFPVLDTAGIAVAGNAGLYRAWDFTAASTENNVGRLRHMRDDAFRGELGQIEDEDGSIVELGRAPDFDVQRIDQGGDFLEIHGTLTVPSYVVPIEPLSIVPLRDALTVTAPGMAQEIADQCHANFPITDFCAVLDAVADGLGNATGGVNSAPTVISPPPNRLFYRPDDEQHPDDPLMQPFGNGLPNRSGEMDVPFMCRLYNSATPDTPARAGIYGHGLLDQRRAITYDRVPQFSRFANFMFCAVDWFGFATGDVANVATMLVDLSLFPVVPDGSQQGMLNQLFLARLLHHPDGLVAHPAFQADDGRPRFANGEVFYHGISQGGILGGVVVAMSKDITRGLFGVPGMNYSTLLRRSTGFSSNIVDPVPVGFSTPLYAAYPDDIDRSLVLSLIQMLWDRSENNGYAHHITDNSALGGPNNQVLMRPAFADHQVSHWSADVMARTIGVELADVYPRRPEVCAVGQATECFATRDDWHAVRNPDLDLLFGMPLSDRDTEYDAPAAMQPGPRSARSGIVHWDQGRTASPPIANIPSNWKDSFDPHGFPRDAAGSFCQQSHFLHSLGRLIDVRQVAGGAECPPLPPE